MKLSMKQRIMLRRIRKEKQKRNKKQQSAVSVTVARQTFNAPVA